MKVAKQQKVLKQEEGMKPPRNGKKSHCMDNLQETADQSNDETWTWLMQGSLKRETEGLIIAA